MAALLDVSDVTLRYKTSSAVVTATERVSFTVDRSDRFVLLGPSGCGKSTLLKAVGGYMTPSEGKMRINGREISEPGADRMMIFQEFDQLLPWKTVLENVMFPLLMTRRLPRKEAEARARAYIEKVSLTRVVDAYPHTLSGGMKQRVAIARGMAMEPDILLMDEPFAALDALTRRTCQDELLQLWAETKFTVLFVTHSIAEAIKIGNRILLLSPHPGRVKAEIVDVDKVSGEDGSAARLEKQIHDLLFADAVDGTLRERAMGEARILLRDAADLAAAVPAEVERKLTVLELLWNDGFVRKTVIIIFLAAVWEAYGTLPRQSAAVSDLPRHHRHDVRQGARRHHSAARLGVAEGAVHGLRRRHHRSRRSSPFSRSRPGSAPISSKPSPRCSIRCRRSRCCRWR